VTLQAESDNSICFGGRIGASYFRRKDHANIFVYEPEGVIASDDHACFEAQRRIGKRLYDHTVSMKAWCHRLREESPVVRRVLDRHAVYLKA
jgi:hypothetical protein